MEAVVEKDAGEILDSVVEPEVKVLEKEAVKEVIQEAPVVSKDFLESAKEEIVSLVKKMEVLVGDVIEGKCFHEKKRSRPFTVSELRPAKNNKTCIAYGKCNHCGYNMSKICAKPAKAKEQ